MSSQRNTSAADRWLRLAAWGWALWWLIWLIASFLAVQLRYVDLDETHVSLFIPLSAVFAVVALKWAGVPFSWRSVGLFALIAAVLWLCGALAGLAVALRQSADA